MRLVSISISDIVRGEIGESEKRLWQVFEVAKTSQPCILFIDEFQALFSSRTDEHSGSSSLITAMFSIFDDLARNPTCRIIILGATNIPSLIDPAFLRMGRVISFSKRIICIFCVYIASIDHPNLSYCPTNECG